MLEVRTHTCRSRVCWYCIALWSALWDICVLMTSQVGCRDWLHLNYDISKTWVILKERAAGQGDHETAATEKGEKTAVISPQVRHKSMGALPEAAEGGCGRSWCLSLSGSFPTWHRAATYLALIDMQKISREFKLLTSAPKCQGSGPSPYHLVLPSAFHHLPHNEGWDQEI